MVLTVVGTKRPCSEGIFLFLFSLSFSLPLVWQLTLFRLFPYALRFYARTPYVRLIISESTHGFRASFRFEFQYPRFAFTFVTPVFFFFSFLLYRFYSTRSQKRVVLVEECTKIIFFFFFNEFLFRFVTFSFVSFKNPPTSFWWRSFFACDSLITTNGEHVWYIYIYLVFFSLSFYRTSWVLFGERETHKTCIFVFLPHPCVFLSGTRETSSVNSTTPGWFLWLRPMHRVGDTNEKGNAIDIADILFFHLLAKSLSQIFQIVDKKKKENVLEIRTPIY